MEEGVPIISISSPQENTSPPLSNHKDFDITGTIVNLDPVDIVRIAWIPAGVNLSTSQQIALGEDVLKTGVPRDGVRIWQRTYDSGQLDENDLIIGGKHFSSQNFSFTFDIFESFKYMNVLENEVKVFMLYTRSKGDEPVDVFYTIRLMPYRQPPLIEIISPKNWDSFGSNHEIHFEIHPTSVSGLEIAEVTLYSQALGDFIPLTKQQKIRQGSDQLIDVWTAVDSHEEMNDYRYEINVKDALGNEEHSDLFIKIAALPKLISITTPHNNGAQFSSRDEILIQAIFERAVDNVYDEFSSPLIRLTGFTHGQYRYAEYTSGAGSNTLVFTYDVQSGDDANVLTADYFDLNNSEMTADIESGALSSSLTAALTAKGIQVRGVSPVITGITITRAEGKQNYNSEVPSYSWHREGEEITFDVALSKEVRVLGSPALILPFSGSAGVNRFATFQTTASNDTVMRFTYKVQDGDSYDYQNLRITTANCFSDAHLLEITDKIGAQGNFLALGTHSVNQTSNVRIDAIKPIAPCVRLLDPAPGDPANSQRFLITASCTHAGTPHGVETYQGTIIQYTINGVKWDNITLPYEAVLTEPTTYDLSARQIDRAGNEGEEFPFITFSLSSFSQLVSIVCDNPDGTYNGGSVLNFKLIFSGPVYSNGNGSVNFNVGTGSNTTVVSRPIQTVTSANASFSLSFSWTVDDNRRMEPVTITSIDLTGVNRVVGQPFTSDGDNADKVSARVSAYNSSRPNLRVLSIRPTITGGAPVSNAVITPNGDYSTITLVFSGPVEPERGYIRIKPTATAGGASGVTTGNWLIPPVLTNEEFILINNALPAASRPSLTNNGAASYYIRTTHGIRQEAGRYVPDTVTKYVLNFESGIDNGTLRPLLNTAKFLWQEIEVVNTERVLGAGTNTITVHLDPLPPGRQWKVEIDENSFRDSASNYFAGWGLEQHANRWFWSQQTATPVIRVDRVSNNRAHSGSQGTFQTGVNYRIDCVTPGAVLTYGEWNRSGSTLPSNTETDIGVLRGLTGGIARITTGTMPGGDPYVANSDNGAQNSNIPDATTSEITTTLFNASTNAYTMGTIRTIDDGSLYTARKDYIGARATRTDLTNSAAGYEGAFKTVVIYRGVNAQVPENNFLKIEATNTRNGAVTIAGFPMWYNDMTGNGSKFFYRNGASNTADFIFITWEIVSEFWQVTPVSRTDVFPGVLHSAPAPDSWQAFSENWFVHNYRSYGNWGMQIGNRGL